MGEVKVQLARIAIFLAFSATAARLMVFAAAFIAPQPLFDTDGGLFSAVIGIRGHPFGFQQCA
jgi:hypothetical protein